MVSGGGEIGAKINQDICVEPEKVLINSENASELTKFYNELKNNDDKEVKFPHFSLLKNAVF